MREKFEVRVLFFCPWVTHYDRIHSQRGVPQKRNKLVSWHQRPRLISLCLAMLDAQGPERAAEGLRNRVEFFRRLQ